MNYFIFPWFRLICNWPSAQLKRPDWKKYFSTFYCVLCIIVGSQIFWIYWQNPVGVKAAYLTQHCLGTRESGDAGCVVRMKPLYLEFCGGFVNWAEIKSIDPVLRPCLVFVIPLHIYICSEKLELIISQGWFVFTHPGSEGSRKKLSRSMAEENQDDLLGPCRLSMVL